MNDRFLTPQELADRWGISVQTIYNHHSQGTLPFATKIFGALRFSESAVRKYEEGHTGRVESGRGRAA